MCISEQQLSLEDYNYLTVKEFCEQYPTFTEASIRSIIYNAKTNGLVEANVIYKNTGRIRIKVSAFFYWYESHNTFHKPDT